MDKGQSNRRMQHGGPIIPSRLEYTFLLEMASISFISTYIAMRVRSISLLTLCGLPPYGLELYLKRRPLRTSS
jgi:hypothetical protein